MNSPELPDNSGWIDAGPREAVPPGGVAELVAGDLVLAIADVDGQLHALDGMCAHQGGPLGKGRLEGCVLTCPWHGWQYDVATGRQTISERVRQRRYAVRVEAGRIWIKPHGD